MKSRLSQALFGFLLLLTLSLNGCVAAATGAAVGIASASLSAADKGFAYYRAGTLRYVDESSFTSMRWAIEKMADQLELVIHKTKQSEPDERPQWMIWWFHNSDGDEIAEVELEPFTPKMMSVKIKMGLFGDKAAGQLLASRIKDHLDEHKRASGSKPTTFDLQ